MTQNEKELLMNDLCARLLYGVKVSFRCNHIHVLKSVLGSGLTLITEIVTNVNTTTDVENIKPYLFPLSSMTEEQWMDTPYANLNNFTFDSFKCGCSTLAFETYEVNLRYVVDFINWCYKNHFDVYGLIEKGLAIDCTDLNIY